MKKAKEKRKAIFGKCDCCGEEFVLEKCTAFGIETWACEACRTLNKSGKGI